MSEKWRRPAEVCPGRSLPVIKYEFLRIKDFGATKVFDHPPITPSTPPLPPSTPKFLPNLLKYPISAAGTVWNRFPVSENPRGQILSPIRWNGDEIEGWPKL